MVVVVDERHDDVPRALQVQVRADEDLHRPGGDEAVDEVLRERAIGLRGLDRAPLGAVLARVEDVRVEPVLVRRVAEPAEVSPEYASVRAREVHYPDALRTVVL